jgi:hypothetical protein
MRRGRAGWVLVSLASLSPSIALADGGDHDKAVALFHEGRALIEQRRCDAAISKLKESLEHEPSIGARLSIADCVETSDPLEAWRNLKAAAALALVLQDERIAPAESRAAALESHLAMLRFGLPAVVQQPGFELRVDGELVDRYLYAGGVATSPGRHLVEASIPGRRFSKTVTTAAGARTLVDVELVADETCAAGRQPSPAMASARAPDGDAATARRALGIAVGGIGLASLATGTVFGLLTLDKKASLDRACGGSVATCTAAPESIEAERQAAKTTAALSTVGFIVGGAAVLGGVAIYVTAPSRARATTGSVRLGPRLARDRVGLSLEGSW